jgi:hypothetical protein
MSRVEKVLLVMALVVVCFCGGFLAALHNHDHGAVCHSDSEWGHMTDCDYRNGAWYAK